MMQAIPSDYMSFSTFYNRERTSNFDNKKGQKKLNAFELMSFVMGRQMQATFEIKGKKKEITLQSPFPKKK